LDNFFFFLKKNVYLFKLEAFMQKKIYPLFLVPCSLALCLVLFFLASCGGGGGGGDDDGDKSSSSDTPYTPSSDNNDPRVEINGLNISVTGWKLIVKGTVELIANFDPDNPLKISKIEVILANKEAPYTTRELLAVSDLDDYYSLSDGQGKGLDFAACALNKYTYDVYVNVYLSDDPKALAKSVSIKDFKQTADNCHDYDLRTETSGGGSVTLNPAGGTYASGTSVTLTATANSGYVFFNWTEDGMVVNESANYTITIDERNVTLKANFVEKRNLSTQETKRCEAGSCVISLGGQTIAFNGTAFTVTSGNATIIDKFKMKNGNEETIRKSIIDPSGTLTTEQFIPATSCANCATNGDGQQYIEYDGLSYFVVKTNSSTWFLLLGVNKDNCTTASNPRCTEVTVWK
jgi:hypothetical protein